MEKVDDIFDALGGPSRFARLIGLKNSTASEMKRRKSIPVEYWPALVRAAENAGLDLNNDRLVHIHTRKHAEPAK